LRLRTGNAYTFSKQQITCKRRTEHEHTKLWDCQNLRFHRIHILHLSCCGRRIRALNSRRRRQHRKFSPNPTSAVSFSIIGFIPLIFVIFFIPAIVLAFFAWITIRAIDGGNYIQARTKSLILGIVGLVFGVFIGGVFFLLAYANLGQTQLPQSPSTQRFCVQCGSPVPPNARFYPRCGKEQPL
jgi:uncharacterized membrane protein YidH (DUF202 family)